MGSIRTPLLELAHRFHLPTPHPPDGGIHAPVPRAPGPRPASAPAREDLAEPSDPEDRPRGRNGNGRYPGDDDRNQASDLESLVTGH